VVSLLQPSPEALSLFDEVILLSDGGHVIFAGPTENACEYFRGLGYAQPDSMDDADYLLTVAGPDRKHLCQGDSSEITSEFSPMENLRPEMTEGHQIGWEKDWAEAIENGRPTIDVDRFMKRYQNSFWTSVRLNLERSFVLWTRDRIFIRASLIKNIAMGLSVGFVFLNTDMNSSFFGVLFQGNLVRI
jgi:ATP-binding cassette subfamily G (WHITE) protein 2 (SNQ2)